MANAEEKLHENDTKIPVFTVLKKGSILKNIFLNYPPPELESSPLPSTENHPQEEDQIEMILIGRHPDCHVVLDHPSISRFHLEIRIQLSSQKLRVTDLSSVHGTWVSGNKIQPHVRVDLEDGDTVRLGASTRIYKLRWVSVGEISDLENLLEGLSDDDEEEETHQVEKSMPITDNPNGLWDAQIPSAPPMPEYLNTSSLKENFFEQVVNHNQTSEVLEDVGVLGCLSDVPVLESVEFSFPVEGNRTPEAFLTAEVPHERENPSNSLSEKKVKSSSLLSRRNKSVSFLRIHRSRSNEESIDGVCFDPRIEAEQPVDGDKDSDQRKGAETLCKVLFAGLEGQEDVQEETVQKENLTPEISLCQKPNDQTELKRSSLKATLGSDHEEDMFTTDKENLTPDNSLRQNPKDQTESMRSSLKTSIGLDGEEDGFPSDKENLTPLVSCSRKSKDISKLQWSYLNAIDRLHREEDVLASDKENLTPKTLLCSELKKDKTGLQRTSLNALVQLEGEDVILSDKENWTPEAPKDSKVRKILSESSLGKEKDDEKTFASQKENQTPQISRDLKSSKPMSQNCQRIESEILKRRVERIPFQSLLETPVSNKKSASVAISSNTIKHTQKMVHKSNSNSANQSVDQMFHSMGAGKKRWNIVVDTSCFLIEESRRSLQLLEGIRGTHLIIPRMVIRELDCLKRRESRFRKAMKGSSPALQWIEECMVKTSWWIHVQSSTEIMPVPPTPPASPRSRLSEGSYEFPARLSNSMPFSTCGSLTEIVSPTAEDHILDCALLFQRIRNDGQLVLLTNNVSLKIKAMAEGLLCETPKDFRESLVNPLSERFLWVGSSPRGPTWSCVDNGGLIENYHHQDHTTRKTGIAAEGARGLKLILLHNSHYGLTNLVK